VDGNPTGFTDPSGLIVGVDDLVIGGIIVAGGAIIAQQANNGANQSSAPNSGGSTGSLDPCKFFPSFPGYQNNNASKKPQQHHICTDKNNVSTHEAAHGRRDSRKCLIKLV
jgi:hypothetical protein